MADDYYSTDYYLKKYREHGTKELEGILYRNSSDYSQEALKAIKIIFDSRTDKSIGIRNKFCPNCERTVKIDQTICQCGYNFKENNIKEIQHVKQKRIIRNRIAGAIMIILGIYWSISKWTYLTQDKNRFLLGLIGFIIIYGIYNLFSGKKVKLKGTYKYTDLLSTQKSLTNSTEDISYTICSTCGKQLFAEMNYEQCPRCGTKINKEA